MTRRLLAVLAVLLLVAGLQLTRIRTWRVLNDIGTHRVFGVSVSTMAGAIRVVAGVALAGVLAVALAAFVRDHFRQR